ncbi:MAG: ECF transporter S component [Anaerostipes sp.]|nr:ECF transporter S component [Anaerostipes sp.]
MNQTKKIVYTALFASLCCVATMLIQIPTPGTSGYIHLGDAFVILSGVILGKKYGAFAAGLGSAFADIFTGYAYYAPVTFIVKFLVAFFAACIFSYLKKKHVSNVVAMIPCGIAGTITVVTGYFIYSYITEGVAAFASIPSNTIQGLSGLVISTILLPILSAVPDIKTAKACMNH